MTIFPAIDIKDGKCVRLLKGDFSTTHQVADDVMKVAADFLACGAEYLHCVDLDGAKDGIRANADIVRQLCRQSGLKVELGGGLRTMRDLEEAEALGVWRFVIGSAAVSNPELVKSAIERYGHNRIAVGVDALNGKVRTHGWERDSGIDVLSFMQDMVALGARIFIYTDISTDGTLAGSPIDQLQNIIRKIPHIELVASGGIANLDDIKALKKCQLSGAIVGKAYYAGSLNLREAIEIAKKAD